MLDKSLVTEVKSYELYSFISPAFTKRKIEIITLTNIPPTKIIWAAFENDRFARDTQKTWL